MSKFESYPSADTLNDNDITLFNKSNITHKVSFATIVNIIKDKIGIGNIDSTPTQNSTNLVISNGIYNAIQNEKNRAINVEQTKANINDTYTKTEIDNKLITTNNTISNISQQIDDLQDKTDKTDIALDTKMSAMVENKIEYVTNTMMDIMNNNYQQIQLQLQQANSSNMIIQSQIPTDGTDASSILLSEISSLSNGQTLSTPSGTVLLNSNVVYAAENITLDFSKTIFIIGSDVNVGMILRLKNCNVIGLQINGDRDNKKSKYNNYSAQEFGRDYLIKIDNNSQNVNYIDCVLTNAPYCAVMLGHNIDNIVFNNLTCSNIGEHVFYKTGYIPYDNNITNLKLTNIQLDNIGVNPSNNTYTHYVNFIKVADDDHADESGIITKTIIDSLNVGNMENATVAMTLFGGNGKFVDTKITNSNFPNLIGNTYISELKVYDSKITNELAYSIMGIVKMNDISLYSCTIKSVSQGANLIDNYIQCVFNSYIKTSEISNVEDIINKDVILFSNCIFNSTTNSVMKHIYNDYLFINCSFNDTNTLSYKSAGLMEFGDDTFQQTHSVSLININSDVNNSDNRYAYLFRCKGKNNYYIYNTLATSRINFTQQVISAYLNDVLFDFSNNYYTPVTNDIKNAQKYSLINVRTANGTIIK